MALHQNPEQPQGTRLRMAPHPPKQNTVRRRSTRMVWGIPVYDIAIGPDPEHNEARGHAKGIIAIGDIATGIFALGGLAQGVIAIGGLSWGLFTIGGVTLGLIAALGGVAMGAFVIGGVAVGLWGLGGAKMILWPLQQAAAYLLPQGTVAAGIVFPAWRRNDRSVNPSGP